MSEDQNSTTNTASTVQGIQGEWVHDNNIYIGSPEDSAQRTYEIGRNYLDNGVPSRARELINKAVAQDYENAEVRFHQVLAMLSKRSYRELTRDERTELGGLPDQLTIYPDNDWTRALEVLCELVEHLDSTECDPAPALNKLQALPRAQREKITRHCDLVLTSGLKDSLWAETRRAAQQGRHDNDRTNRAWAYFQPEPVEPRSRQPAPNATTVSDLLRAGLAAGLLAVGLGLLGSVLLQRPTTLAILAYVLVLACGVVAVKSGFEWRYRTQRIAAKERDYTRFNHRDPPEKGFASRVDHDFEHYAYKYAPKTTGRLTWLAETKGIRTTLRNEVVELYREQQVESEQVRWLVRHLIQRLSTQWTDGTLFSYREQYRTPLSTKIQCVLALGIGLIAAVTVVGTAVATAPLSALGSALMAVVGAHAAALPWWRIASERRRFIEESLESKRNKETRTAAYNRWKRKLAATCPDESEMAHWLECDKVILADQALQHYNLAWRDIIAHTIVQTPAPCRRRARLPGGPWRYQQYHLQLFLITTDGVREMYRQLDFEEGGFDREERGHFRFDAVSSLHVTESELRNYTLQLTLTNGPARIIDATEPPRDLEYPSASDSTVSQVSLDSAGFNHALYVLEGIAAEGKAWIQRANNRATTQSFSKSSPSPAH